jgi:hypothetical protein
LQKIDQTHLIQGGDWSVRVFFSNFFWQLRGQKRTEKFTTTCLYRGKIGIFGVFGQKSGFWGVPPPPPRRGTPPGGGAPPPPPGGGPGGGVPPPPGAPEGGPPGVPGGVVRGSPGGYPGGGGVPGGVPPPRGGLGGGGGRDPGSGFHGCHRIAKNRGPGCGFPPSGLPLGYRWGGVENEELPCCFHLTIVSVLWCSSFSYVLLRAAPAAARHRRRTCRVFPGRQDRPSVRRQEPGHRAGVQREPARPVRSCRGVIIAERARRQRGVLPDEELPRPIRPGRRRTAARPSHRESRRRGALQEERRRCPERS